MKNKKDFVDREEFRNWKDKYIISLMIIVLFAILIFSETIISFSIINKKINLIYPIINNTHFECLEYESKENKVLLSEWCDKSKSGYIPTIINLKNGTSTYYKSILTPNGKRISYLDDCNYFEDEIYKWNETKCTKEMLIRDVKNITNNWNNGTTKNRMKDLLFLSRASGAVSSKWYNITLLMMFPITILLVWILDHFDVKK